MKDNLKVVANALRVRNAASPSQVKAEVLRKLTGAYQLISEARKACGVWEIDEAQGLAYDIDDLMKECDNLIKAAKNYN